MINCSNCGATNSENAKYCKACGHALPAPIENKSIPELPLEKKNKVDYKKMLGIFIGIIVSVSVQQYLTRKPMYDEAMTQAASEINKTCPIMVDSETQLDNAISLPGNLFMYNYTLINVNVGDLDTAATKQALEPNIVNFVKTNPQMEIQRQHKTTICYYYKDKIGKYLFAIYVTPEKYEAVE